MTDINNKYNEDKQVVDKKGRDGDSKLAMVPLFSWRSILVLSTGLIVGLLLAFAYWLISPLFITQEDPENQVYADNVEIMNRLGIDTGGPYQSTVNVQIVNPESNYMSAAALQQFGEYYTAKGNSLQFFEFLSQELEKYQLSTAYTIDDISKMVLVEYDYLSELPVIKVTTVAPTKEEATFFAAFIPQTFLDYLIFEEENEQEKQYNDTLEEIEVIKEALYEAHQKLVALDSPDILDNPDYISLTAKVDALQQELNTQLDLLALEYYGETELQEAYSSILLEIEVVVTELAEAEQDLQNASQQGMGTNSYNPDILVLEAKIRGLENQLDILVSGTTITTGLTELIINGITSGPQYNILMAKIDTTSQALAEAMQEYDELINSSTEQSTVTSFEYQLAQMKVDILDSELNDLEEQLAVIYTQMIISNNENGNIESAYNYTLEALNEAKDELETLENQLGYDHLYRDIEYEITQDIISRLNRRVGTLNEELGSLVADNTESLDTRYLVMGNPSTPTPLLQQRDRARDILIMGGILGVVVAWILLNFRWLWRSLSYKSSSADIDEEL